MGNRIKTNSKFFLFGFLALALTAVFQNCSGSLRFDGQQKATNIPTVTAHGGATPAGATPNTNTVVTSQAGEIYSGKLYVSYGPCSPTDNIRAQLIVLADGSGKLLKNNCLKLNPASNVAATEIQYNAITKDVLTYSAMTFYVQPMAPVAASLVVNPSFESSDASMGWTVIGAPGTPLNPGQFSGNVSMRLSQDTNEINQTIPGLSPIVGSTLILTAVARLNTAPGVPQ